MLRCPIEKICLTLVTNRLPEILLKDCTGNLPWVILGTY